MCFKSMNKQHNNKKHMVFLRIYPCSSELTNRQQLSLWGKGMKAVSNVLERLQGEETEGKERVTGLYHW